MKELSGLSLSLELTKNLNRNLGLNSSVMSMIKLQDDLTRKFKPYQHIFELTNKANIMANLFARSETGTLLRLAQTIQRQTKFNIPSRTMTAIDMVARQNQNLFHSTKDY